MTSVHRFVNINKIITQLVGSSITIEWTDFLISEILLVESNFIFAYMVLLSSAIYTRTKSMYN